MKYSAFIVPGTVIVRVQFKGYAIVVQGFLVSLSILLRVIHSMMLLKS
jgi:hypothetical protein